ncbi:MAG: EAL domain-containing protein [Roseibium sp.]|uniref:EAL domain-containing protein n=1 Tax=Roseibium sp. TaxID=1936156 RepID=UPI001B2B04A3|nr:EAL domain-containing protein [Roseibium sp.]MBO6892663.1 EAL domain-containing protein [Roseibium sp.]MBO6928208.1 EAL domain-containing protein [Roseibium sp.]
MHQQDATAKLNRKNVIASSLEGALSRDDFSFVLQPQIDLQTREFSGTEVLLRWSDSPFGMTSPGEFIPVAEEFGLMPRLGEWVFANICKMLQRWQETGWRLPDRLAVNVSTNQLATPGFRDFLLRTAGQHNLFPCSFELEVSESALMTEEHVETLKLLREDGFTITVDDFGTGFTSLAQFRNFTADKLKIDISFVHDMHRDDASYAIVSTIVAMAERLAMTVVAEGVETEKQASTLRKLGCDQAQGFLFSRPLNAEVYRSDWLTRAVLQFPGDTDRGSNPDFKRLQPVRRQL